MIYLSDLSPFVPKLKNYNSPLNLNIKAEGTVNDIHINDIKIYSKDKIDINANGYINGITNISESYNGITDDNSIIVDTLIRESIETVLKDYLQEPIV